MLKPLRNVLATAVASGLLLASSSVIADGSKTYQVTITNLTNSINFTPILVASHRKNVSLFELGSASSDELATIAESGNAAPLAEHIMDNDESADVKNSGALLMPGQSVTISVSAKGRRHVSVASMMLPTNDGFIALNSVKVSKHGTTTYYSPGYDAGSEPNDELCMNIPGPTCGGIGASPDAGGEGYVHIHRGIHGIGDPDLVPDVYDWRNPVAKITITRSRGDDD